MIITNRKLCKKFIAIAKLIESKNEEAKKPMKSKHSYECKYITLTKMSWF